MATDTKVTALVLNELSEEKLKELEDTGTVPPNEVFLTNGDEISPRGLPLGTIIPAAVISDDASLHLLDGSSLIQNGIYKQFCDWLKARVLANSGNVPTCTIAEYANEMSTYGQCGKFVINNTSSVQASNGYRVEANSIKLPTITEFIASNNGGDTIGLAELDMFKSHNHDAWGDYPFVQAPILVARTSGSDVYAGGHSFNYTDYTGGEETRPKNIRYPYYIVVASSVKTDVEVDIDNVTNDINTINSTLNKTEQVEVIYDKDDPNKDWGYSGGINGNVLKLFSKSYKKLLIHYQCYYWGSQLTTGGTSNIITLDLTKIVGNYATASNLNLYKKEAGSFSTNKTFGIFVEYNPISGDFGAQFAYNDVFEQSATEYHVYKIEGVY